MAWAAEQITASCTEHGEGPVWDAARGVLHWVDLLKGDVLSISPEGGKPTRLHVGDVAACVVPRETGGLVVATERGFSLVDEGAGIRSLGALWADPGIRMNDGACDPQGRFYAGSMAYDESPGRGNLYRLDPSHDVTVVLTGVTVSNGLGWSPDGKTAYYIDSPTRRIDVLRFDPETGRFANRRPLVAVPEGDGVPDGLSVDSEGGIWVALWHGSALHRYLPDGSLDGTLSLPVSNPTSCAFGGVDLDTLFITTSAQSVSLDVEPAAGALFSCRPGFSGQPIGTFLG